jgi:NAD+ diphosphatase
MDQKFPKPLYEPCHFAGGELDRLEHRRSNGSWINRALKKKSARFIIFSDGKPLVNTKPKVLPAYQSYEAISDFLKEKPTTVLLGSGGKHNYFAVDLSGVDAKETKSLAKKGANFKDLRSVAIAFTATPYKVDLANLGLAKALLGWHESHQFCSRCGTKTKLRRAGYMRKCAKPSCETEHFPRTDPVVIMLAIRDGKCLLGRQPQFLEGVYSALAGFMEPGESIEEAVRRELYEEAGIRVGEVTYFASQPWPFPASLMIGCYAEALNDDFEMRDGELQNLRWVLREEMRAAVEGQPKADFQLPPRMAISHRLIRSWMLFGDE